MIKHVLCLLALAALATGCTTRVGPRTGITREQAVKEWNEHVKGNNRNAFADATGYGHPHVEVTGVEYRGNTQTVYGHRWVQRHEYSSITEVGIRRPMLGLLFFGLADPTLFHSVYVKLSDNTVPGQEERFAAPLGLYTWFPFYFFRPAGLQVRKPAETLEALRLNQFDSPSAASTETK